MQSKENNYAFIDSQNLNLSIKSLGWNLDFQKFRRYLKEKYSALLKRFPSEYIAFINDLKRKLSYKKRTQ